MLSHCYYLDYLVGEVIMETFLAGRLKPLRTAVYRNVELAFWMRP